MKRNGPKKTNEKISDLTQEDIQMHILGTNRGTGKWKPKW